MNDGIRALITTPRAGARPATSDSGPHRQLDQRASTELWGRLVAGVFALPGTEEGLSQVSPSSSRAVFLADQHSERSPETSLAPGRRLEPVHLHGVDDTSVHLCLPAVRGRQLTGLGWAEPHQYEEFGTEFMIYGPRTPEELQVVLSIVEESIAFARGHEQSERISVESTVEASVIDSRTIGGAWLAVAERILASGVPAAWDGRPILEVRTVTLDVAAPDPADAVIARFADPERLAWMHENFTDFRRVRALGDAASYASRLFDYLRSGRDQIAWVTDRLRADATRRDVTITTLEPTLDTTYIPCVSLLDFWIPDGRLDLVVAAHSIDFGTKGYANLVELADLQHRVARELGVPVGRLTMTVKSAHIYDPEIAPMRAVCAEAAGDDRTPGVTGGSVL